MILLIINCCIFLTLASFITLCARRQLIGQFPWSPRYSYCDHCNHQLQWWQLIPILGFIIQRGKCYWCNVHISPYFPLTESLVLIIGIKTFNFSYTHDLIIMTGVLALLYLSTTDYIAKVIFPHALIGLFPLILILPSTKLPPAFILIELLLIAAFLFLLQYFTNGLGTGDIEFILVTDFLWHWEITAQIIFCGCLFTLLFFLIKKGRRQPLIPGLAFGFFLELFFRL